MIVHDDRHAREIVERELRVKIYEPFSGVVICHGEAAVGACIFNNYCGRDVHFTCVFDGLMTINDARIVSRYVFGQLGCQRCTAITRSGNAAARMALRQLGFKIEGFLREHFDDDDGVVYGLLKSEQRITR